MPMDGQHSTALIRVQPVESGFRWVASINRGEPEIGGRQLADTLSSAYFAQSSSAADVPPHGRVFEGFGQLARYMKQRFIDFGSPLLEAHGDFGRIKWVYDVLRSPRGRRPLLRVSYRHGGPEPHETELTRVFYGRAEQFDSAFLLQQAMRLDESSRLVADIREEMLYANVAVLPFRALGAMAERVGLEVEDVFDALKRAAVSGGSFGYVVSREALRATPESPADELVQLCLAPAFSATTDNFVLCR